MKPLVRRIVPIVKTNGRGLQHQGEAACASKGEGNHCPVQVDVLPGKATCCLGLKQYAQEGDGMNRDRSRHA